MKEIPKQKEHAEQTQGDYRLILKNKKMAEENWQETIKTYTRQDAEEFQDAVNQYRENLAAAQAQKEAAQAAAGTEVRPDLKKLEQEKEEAEQKYQAVKIRYDNLRQEFSSNAEVQGIIWSGFCMRRIGVSGRCLPGSLNSECTILRKQAKAKTEAWI